MRTISMIVGALASAAAQAHSGHGAEPALHWHAFDTWGWALALALAALGLWLSRRR